MFETITSVTANEFLDPHSGNWNLILSVGNPAISLEKPAKKIFGDSAIENLCCNDVEFYINKTK